MVAQSWYSARQCLEATGQRGTRPAGWYRPACQMTWQATASGRSASRHQPASQQAGARQAPQQPACNCLQGLWQIPQNALLAVCGAGASRTRQARRAGGSGLGAGTARMAGTPGRMGASGASVARRPTLAARPPACPAWSVGHPSPSLPRPCCRVLRTPSETTGRLPAASALHSGLQSSGRGVRTPVGRPSPAGAVSGALLLTWVARPPGFSRLLVAWRSLALSSRLLSKHPRSAGCRRPRQPSCPDVLLSVPLVLWRCPHGGRLPKAACPAHMAWAASPALAAAQLFLAAGHLWWPSLAQHMCHGLPKLSQARAARARPCCSTQLACRPLLWSCARGAPPAAPITALRKRIVAHHRPCMAPRHRLSQPARPHGLAASCCARAPSSGAMPGEAEVCCCWMAA